MRVALHADVNTGVGKSMALQGSGLVAEVRGCGTNVPCQQVICIALSSQADHAGPSLT
jgi:hypothetical protein